jgi:hypothetical protein
MRGAPTGRGARPIFEGGGMQEEPAPAQFMKGGNVEFGGAEQRNQEALVAQGKLDAIAPLIKPADSDQPVSAKVRVTWYVVFKPEQPAEGGNK